MLKGVLLVSLIEFKSYYGLRSCPRASEANIPPKHRTVKMAKQTLMLEYNTETASVEAEQLSIVLGDNFLLTFQEKPGDFFGEVRNETGMAESVVRKMGPDYLACRIIDVIVDNYFGTVEKFGEEIEEKEDELVNNPDRKVLASIQDVKKNMLRLRQYVWPVREILSNLEKKESSLIKDETIAYFRDVYDRLFEAMDLIETTREMVSDLIDIYLSSMSNRTNEVMKVLTVVATIFIPLTFIVGLYGMNFKYMPELDATWGYPAVLIFMLIVAVSMLIYFHRRKVGYSPGYFTAAGVTNKHCITHFKISFHFDDTGRQKTFSSLQQSRNRAFININLTLDG